MKKSLLWVCAEPAVNQLNWMTLCSNIMKKGDKFLSLSPLPPPVLICFLYNSLSPRHKKSNKCIIFKNIQKRAALYLVF